jgi:hypothetical protein
MGPVVAMWVNEGSAINRTMLTLIPSIPSPTRMPNKRFRHRCPPFEGPSRVIVNGSMRLTGDFATDGPIHIDGGWGTHDERLLRVDEERAPVAVSACGSEKWGEPMRDHECGQAL